MKPKLEDAIRCDNHRCRKASLDQSDFRSCRKCETVVCEKCAEDWESESLCPACEGDDKDEDA